MLPYWLLFSVFSFGALQAQAQPRQRVSKPLVVAGILIALMIGLRFRVGGDWANYREMYVMYGFMDLWESIRWGDPGYSLINWASHQLGLGIWFVNLVCAAIFTFGLIRFAGRQPNPWLACLVAVPYLIIVVAMGYTRQAVAIGLIFLALEAFGRQNIVRFLVWMLMAAAFHKTAIVTLPLIIASMTHNRFILGGLFVVTTVLMYYFFLDASIGRFVTNYLEANFDSDGAAIRVAMNGIAALVFLFLQHKLHLSAQERLIWRNFSLAALACVAALWLVSSSTVVDRLALYLIPLQLILFGRLPYVFSDHRRGGRLIVLLIIAYSATVQLVWLNYANHSQLWVPYQVYPIGDPLAATR